MIYVVYQEKKLDEDLEEVTNKVYFDIEIDGKSMGMFVLCMCVCVFDHGPGYALCTDYDLF